MYPYHTSKQRPIPHMSDIKKSSQAKPILSWEQSGGASKKYDVLSPENMKRTQEFFSPRNEMTLKASERSIKSKPKKSHRKRFFVILFLMVFLAGILFALYQAQRIKEQVLSE